jgi:transcription antitermination protein NusB
MRRRREARERAVQILFQLDLNPTDDLGAALDKFWDNQRLNLYLEAQSGPTYGENVQPPPPSADELATRLFADELARGVLDRRAEIDAVIQKHAQNWDIKRMAVVDRNVMRLAIHEMLHRDDIPPVVSINEAVDIAKKFSTEESGRFVNGILDKVKGELLRPARSARGVEPV